VLSQPKNVKPSRVGFAGKFMPSTQAMLTFGQVMVRVVEPCPPLASKVTVEVVSPCGIFVPVTMANEDAAAILKTTSMRVLQ
jgi:hypothetical protein